MTKNVAVDLNGRAFAVLLEDETHHAGNWGLNGIGPDWSDAPSQSVILCGVRDVRDCRIESTAKNAVIAGGSAFNVRTESLRWPISRPRMCAPFTLNTPKKHSRLAPKRRWR